MSAPDAPIRLGVAGLGLAASFMIRAAVADRRIVLAAGADPQPAPRQRFATTFGAAAYDDVIALCRDPSLDAVYIASPHRFHADQAVCALEHGKHVLVEKPMGLNVTACERVRHTAERCGKGVIVGHTHAFDPNVRSIADIARTNALGRLGMIATLNYNDFLFRPHRHDEFDPIFGGGILFNQIAHQVEIVRAIADSAVVRVQAHLGSLNTSRQAPGHGSAMIFFDNGCVASLVFSAYDGFDSDVWHYDVAEGGTEKVYKPGSTRLAFESRSLAESEAHAGLSFGARALQTDQPYLPHFGVLIATFEKGDVRLAANGILIHGARGIEERSIDRGDVRAGHGDVLSDLYQLVREDRPSRYDATWGRDTVAVLSALRASAAEQREISLDNSNRWDRGSK